ncbi:contactin-6-like isoform X1 [Cloeon dipterum]|uniref:contactin-6-like isoform X1 n=1 Tax=Cloeon dipterum TaxID=197152 RepID=UPI0032203EDE
MLHRMMAKFTWTLMLILVSDLGAAAKIVAPAEEAGKVSEALAVAGGIAKLPCDLSSSAPGDKVQLVMWFFGTKDSPIYTLDRRSTPDDGKHWSEKEKLQGRAYFRLDDDPAKLTIEDVKETDQGQYRCRVDFKKSPTRNSVVNLAVILPPDKLIILDEKGASVPNYVVGPYNEGASVDITCIATGGRPPPRVSWWQENALLDDSSESLDDRRVKNVLRLGKLERRHLHTVYTCQASNNNISAPISSAVSVDLNLRPLSVELVGQNRPLSADNTFELECQCVGSRPTADISWWKASVPLRDTRKETSSDGNITTSFLKFIPQLEDAGKMITCRGSNPAIENSALEDGWKLDIHHVPLVTLELGSNLNASQIREGIDVYFECNIKSNPWVYKVTWRQNGKLLVNNASAGIIVSNQSLVLQSVTRAHAGRYTCVGSNQEGDGESNPVFLDVKYIPVCKSNQPDLFGVARQESAKITCNLDANPTDIQFIWKFNNTSETLDIPMAHMSVDRAKSVATYTPMNELDYGTLLCWGRNELGLQKHPCVFHIIPAGKPDAVHNCSIVNQTAESLHVECAEGFNGGLPQTFTMEVFDALTFALVSKVTGNTPTFTINGLEAGVSFQIELSASNDKGRSAKTTLHAYTLKAAEKRTECNTAAGCVAAATSPAAILQMTPILGVLIGVVSALFLVAVIIVVVMRLRGHDDEDELEKEMEERIGTSGSGGGRQPPNTMSRGVGGPVPSDKSSLGKDTDVDSTDEKNPDIIPHSTDSEYLDPDEKAFEVLNNAPPRMYDTLPHHLHIRNNQMEPASSYETVNMNNTMNTTLPGEEITYAELAVPKQHGPVMMYPSHTLGRRPHHPAQHEPTVYAQIMDLSGKIPAGHMGMHHTLGRRPILVAPAPPLRVSSNRADDREELLAGVETPLIAGTLPRESTEGAAGSSDPRASTSGSSQPRVVTTTRF